MSILELKLEDESHDKLVIESNLGKGMNFSFETNEIYDYCVSVMNRNDLIKIIDTIQEHLDETEL
jgi:hypothetical protein